MGEWLFSGFEKLKYFIPRFEVKFKVVRSVDLEVGRQHISWLIYSFLSFQARVICQEFSNFRPDFKQCEQYLFHNQYFKSCTKVKAGVQQCIAKIGAGPANFSISNIAGLVRGWTCPKIISFNSSTHIQSALQPVGRISNIPTSAMQTVGPQ